MVVDNELVTSSTPEETEVLSIYFRATSAYATATGIA